jgi:hypothetical protein
MNGSLHPSIGYLNSWYKGMSDGDQCLSLGLLPLQLISQPKNLIKMQ